jgi:uncharacterized protein YeaO (DUF488 family)
MKNYNNIKLDCYLAVLKKYREKYPNALFEVITRTAKSPLSPSWELLNKAKEQNWSFERYKRAFLKEIKNNSRAKEKMKEIKKKARGGRTVFLVCYEKNPNECHRSIIKDFLENKI